MAYRVKEVADLTGISIRTLHHYDHIGLLKPSFLTDAGYRMYNNQDLERLQQILFFKELDFPLQKIKEILDHPAFDPKHALQLHREVIIAKKERLERIIQTIDQKIQEIEEGAEMEKNKMFTAFNLKEIEEHKKKYSEEAKQTYGKEFVRQVEEVTASYTDAQWSFIMGKWKDLYERMARYIGDNPSHPEVQRAVDEYRQLITDYFYDCTPEIFRGLGDLYVQDERFTKNIDQYGNGLSRFLCEAIHIYCDQLKAADGSLSCKAKNPPR